MLGQQDPSLLEGLSNSPNPEHPLDWVQFFPADRPFRPGLVLVAGVGLAARENQRAGREVDLVVALYHQHLEFRLVAQQQYGGGRLRLGGLWRIAQRELRRIG